MRRTGLTDTALRQAVAEMADGLVDADLGGGLLEKRVPLPGRGKRAGARTIVAARRGSHWFFVYGYAKSEREDLGVPELRALRELARDLLDLDERALEAALRSGALIEVDRCRSDVGAARWVRCSRPRATCTGRS